jgi:hypothetical protein
MSRLAARGDFQLGESLAAAVSVRQSLVCHVVRQRTSFGCLDN